MKKEDYKQLIENALKHLRKILFSDFFSIVNSALSLLVLPYEKFYKEGETISLTKEILGSIKINPEYGLFSENEIFKYLRHGIAHTNIEPISDNEGKIIEMKIWNIHPRDGRNFEANIALKDFKTFLEYVGDEYVSKFEKEINNPKNPTI